MLELARLADVPACALMERVQVEVSQLWSGAVVSCFGSRATGLACALHCATARGLVRALHIAADRILHLASRTSTKSHLSMKKDSQTK